MSFDEKAVIAANNNADLYEAMFASHGVSYERLPFAFVGKENPPPYYSNLTVLSPNHVDEVKLQIANAAKQFNGRVGLKDSFCELKLEANGFDILFSASWIWLEGNTQSTSADWQFVEDEADLVLWEEAWKKSGSPTQYRMFNTAMLARQEIFFCGRKTNGKFEAGCIANRSADCIGISNVFSKTQSNGVFAEATAAVALIAPGMPIAGYESGEDLEHARIAGFSTVGDLRILVANAAEF